MSEDEAKVAAKALKKAKKAKKDSKATPTPVDAAPADGAKPKKAKKAKKEKKDKKEAADEGSSKKRARTDDGNDGNDADEAKRIKQQKKDKKKQKKEQAVAAAAASTSGTATPAVVNTNVVTMNAIEAAKYTAEHNIKVTGVSGIHPVNRFDACGFPPAIVESCKHFKAPTPIQSQAWPILATGRDMIGIAATGSGKTIAFSFPFFKHVKDHKQTKNPKVLVVAPTRELASQTNDVCQEVGTKAGIRSLVVYGGINKAPQRSALKSGIDVLVCTPGRLLDLQEEGSVDLSEVDFLVLDEADRMLDMGFEKDIRRIISHIKPKRRTLMFSATWPVEIQKLAAEFLNNPVRVTIGCEDLAANHNVQQNVEVLDGRMKEKRLVELLNKLHKNGNRIIIFALYKKEAERVLKNLEYKGYRGSVCAIHGNMGQAERTESLGLFKSGKRPLLVATDVAARGLDIPDVEAVINYTFPLTIEDYVHRIGRTGRAGKKGVSHTLFTVDDKSRAGDLQNILREANVEIPPALLKFGGTIKRKVDKMYGDISGKEDLIGVKATKMTF